MFMEKLKKMFKVSSTYQLVVVFIVFGITGSLSLFISDYVLDILELDYEQSINEPTNIDEVKLLGLNLTYKF